MAKRKKAKDVVIDRCGDEYGDLWRLGRRGSRYYTERIAPAFEAGSGRVTRTYIPKAKATKEFVNGCRYLGL